MISSSEKIGPTFQHTQRMINQSLLCFFQTKKIKFKYYSKTKTLNQKFIQNNTNNTNSIVFKTKKNYKIKLNFEK